VNTYGSPRQQVTTDGQWVQRVGDEVGLSAPDNEPHWRRTGQAYSTGSRLDSTQLSQLNQLNGNVHSCCPDRQ